MSDVLLIPFFKGKLKDLNELIKWSEKTRSYIDKFFKKNTNYADVEKREKIGANLTQALEYIELSTEKLDNLYENMGGSNRLANLENAQFIKSKYKNALKTFVKEASDVDISGTKSFERMKSFFPETSYKELKNIKTLNYICGLLQNKIWDKIDENSVKTYLENKMSGKM